MRRTIASSVLLSSLLFTAAANASPPSASAPALTNRITTGVTPPQLLNSLALTVPDRETGAVVPNGTQIDVSFVVDPKGQPRNIQVVKGYSVLWNARAIQAVSQLHYRPASIDNQAVPMVVNLVIAITE